MTWPGLVIFDCDGVLVDSEPLSRAVIVEESQRLGAAMTEADACRFTGLRWGDVQAALQARLSTPLPEGWAAGMQARVIARMEQGLRPIPGARAAIESVQALGIPFRIASNSSPEEMDAKFRLVGLSDLVAGRTLSAREVGRGKPDPALFLAAAAAADVAPADCLVIEDSEPGIRAALAAGMTCLAYDPAGPAPRLAALGAQPLADLAALPRAIATLRQARSARAA
jgi:HAD superfamily hydrolase (TIGR01509 family)